jgi:hypothetical protein
VAACHHTFKCKEEKKKVKRRSRDFEGLSRKEKKEKELKLSAKGNKKSKRTEADCKGEKVERKELKLILKGN